MPLCKAQKEPIGIYQHLLTFKTPVPHILPQAEGHHTASAMGHKSNPRTQA